MNRYGPAVALTLALANVVPVHAQLVTAYTGDESGAKNWLVDVTTGNAPEGPFERSRALASDPTTGRIFLIRPRGLGSGGAARLVIYDVAPDGGVAQASSALIFTPQGEAVRIVSSLAYGFGTLYAFDSGAGDTDPSLVTIDLATGVATTLLSLDEIQVPGDAFLVQGLTFDLDRQQLLLGVRQGAAGSEFQVVYGLDPSTGAVESLFETPTLFDGLAYGYGRVFMDCGAPCGPIQVFNRITG